MVLLHGWPGGRTDFRLPTALLTGVADVLVPDLRGYGESDKRRRRRAAWPVCSPAPTPCWSAS